jgi:hypothetical protein
MPKLKHPDVDEIPFKTTDAYIPRARIVKAACYSGKRCFTAWRHATILQQAFAPRQWKMIQACQGFVDEFGFWWDRMESAYIAAKAQQINGLPDDRILISEMLWDEDGKPKEMDR